MKKKINNIEYRLTTKRDEIKYIYIPDKDFKYRL